MLDTLGAWLSLLRHANCRSAGSLVICSSQTYFLPGRTHFEKSSGCSEWGICQPCSYFGAEECHFSLNVSLLRTVGDSLSLKSPRNDSDWVRYGVGA